MCLRYPSRHRTTVVGHPRRRPLLDRGAERTSEPMTTAPCWSQLVGILTMVTTLIGSQLVLNEQVRSFDERLFARLVPWLQDAEWLVDDLGGRHRSRVEERGVWRGAASHGGTRRDRAFRPSCARASRSRWWRSTACSGSPCVAPGVVPTEHVIGAARAVLLRRRGARDGGERSDRVRHRRRTPSGRPVVALGVFHWRPD